MEDLVVRLGSNIQDQVHWLVWSAQEQEIIASGVLENAEQLSSLSERAGQRPVTVLVPGCDFYLKWVSLPAKASRKAMSAIPYMLEEELSNDISQQFFAMGIRKANLQSVAVVSKAKMQQWLESLRAAGLYCDKMLPDILALPHTPDAWNFVSLGAQAIVRQDEWQGMQGDTNWILPAIEHYAKQQSTPLEIANHSEQSLANLANVNVQEQTLEMPMQLLANGALKSNFNLLQGEYKPKQKASGDLRKWRLVAILAGVALLVTLIDKGFEVNKLKQQSSLLTQQMRTEYKRAFPNKPPPVNIRRAMERDLAALQRGGGGVSVIAMMAELADAFDNSNVKPQSIRFDSARTELRLQAVANNFEALELFKRLAQQKGFSVEQGAINNKDNQVIGSLSIRS